MSASGERRLTRGAAQAAAQATAAAAAAAAASAAEEEDEVVTIEPAPFKAGPGRRVTSTAIPRFKAWKTKQGKKLGGLTEEKWEKYTILVDKKNHLKGVTAAPLAVGAALAAAAGAAASSSSASSAAAASGGKTVREMERTTKFMNARN